MRIPTYRQLRKALLKHDDSFEFYERKGKGSHRAIRHPRFPEVTMIIPVHSEGSDVTKPYLGQLKRKFELPDDFFD